MMSKYLQSYDIYKEIILETTKQWVEMVTMRIVRELDVKKETYELSVFLAKVWAQQADNDSSKPPENVHKNVFLVESFDWNIIFS